MEYHDFPTNPYGNSWRRCYLRLVVFPHIYIYIYIEWANALVPPTPFQGRPGHYSGTPCQCQCHGWEGCPTNRFCLYNSTYPGLLVVKVWQKQTITTPWTVNAQDKVGTGSGNDWNKVGLLGVVIINHHLSRSVGTNVGCFPCLCPWFWNSKRQAAMLERWRPGAWWKLPRGMWRVLGVVRVWSLANGRFECPNKRGLCAGKGQASMLERWRPGKGRLQPWSSKGWRPGLVEAAAKELDGFRGFRGLKPGKRQARMP